MGKGGNPPHFEFRCRFGARWLKLQNPALALAEDLLLSVLVVELEDECFSAQNLYLRDKVVTLLLPFFQLSAEKHTNQTDYLET